MAAGYHLVTLPAVRARLAIAALLLAAIGIVYLPVLGHRFVHYDDFEEVVENPIVRAGITPDGVRRAFVERHRQSRTMTLVPRKEIQRE